MTKPTLDETVDAIKAALPIEMPDNIDCEGDPLNDENVLDELTHAEVKTVEEARETVREYIAPGGELDQRSLTALKNRGIDVTFNRDQYDQDRYVGRVIVNRDTDTFINLDDRPVNRV
ncbi:MAG TPA: hypothetical protein DIW86_10960 [Pseudomonas sp.]|jgi:hypothetical protein|nr:hypothetical protein [Pseudomonas sp.]